MTPTTKTKKVRSKPSQSSVHQMMLKKLKTDKILEYGDEVDVESESPEPGRIRARVTEVDNDAFFTNKVTVEAIHES